MGWDLVKDLLAPLVAICAAASSMFFALRGANIQKESLRVQRDNDVLHWGNATIETLSQLESIASVGDSHPELVTRYLIKKLECMAELSAAIDKGRMYFPNVQKDDHGTNKDPAFRGYRRPILDALADAYHASANYQFGDALSMQTVRKEINLSRRRFVSELQKAVDPERRLRFLAQNAGIMDVDQVSEDVHAAALKLRKQS
jgi:hypothetical protein